MNCMLKWIPVLLMATVVSAQAPSPAPQTNSAVHAAADSPWLLPLTGGEDATTKKARALLTQMIETIGGQAYMDLQSVEQNGLGYSFYNGKPNSVGTEFHRIFKFPDKERVELTKKRDVIYIENGDKGYEITFKGTSLQDPQTWRDYVRRRNYSMEWLLRIWLKQPGTMIFYEGTAIAEQRMAEVVTLVNAKNESASFYIDQNTHLPIKKTFSYRSPLDRQKDEEGEIYGNWRLEGSINTPHSIVRTHNGEYANQRFIKTVTYNVPTPDSLFAATPTYDPYVLERKLDEQKQQQKP
jgi:hypothetical protein